MKPFGAYVHARPDGRIFYVGKGKEKRAHQLKRNAHHLNIVSKHGAENIRVGFMSCSSEVIAFDLERGLIKCLRRSGVQIVNLTDGGEGTSGRAITPEFRAKMSCVANARSYETRHKLREAARQQWLRTSPAEREAARERTRQQMADPQTRKRIGDTHRGSHNTAGLKWVKRDGVYTRIKLHEVGEFISNGWQLGRGKISEEHKAALLRGIQKKKLSRKAK